MGRGVREFGTELAWEGEYVMPVVRNLATDVCISHPHMFIMCYVLCLLRKPKSRSRRNIGQRQMRTNLLCQSNSCMIQSLPWMEFPNV
ncbi:hypothetical protein SASPL_118845 [Salvia splendens]|uniref:Uncharacterized protein n=1 Tax=Salvia splendens TaxID=180675 RepID=A0A8X9A0B3_SALSN|nr:hypothetical protein SASPL_118845 [Salvia splendens]